MVPAARLELARGYPRQILSLLCLPFHQAGTGKTLSAPEFQIKGKIILTLCLHAKNIHEPRSF